MDKFLEKIESYISYAVIFLLPLAVLSSFTNAFETVKLSILAFGVCLLLLVKVIRVIASGNLDIIVGTFDFPVFLIAAAYLVATIARTPNKMDAFFSPGTTTAVIGGALFYFLLNQRNLEEKLRAKMILFFSGIIFSVIVLLAGATLLGKIPQLPAFAKTVAFNPAGGLLPAAVFLAVLIPLGLGMLLSEKHAQRKMFLGAGLAIMTFALIMTIFNMLPGKPFSPRFPSAGVSWNIAVEAMKASPIIGIGPGNYLTAFSRYRPLSYNQTDLWAVKFATANDYYLTAFTETGLLGAAGLILLILSFYRFAKAKIKESRIAKWGMAGNSNIFSLGLLIILMTLFPVTSLLLFLFFVLLSFNSEGKKSSLNLSTAPVADAGGPQAAQKVASRLPAILISVPVLIFVILVAARGGRILAADLKYRKALNALAANDVATYDLMRQAINLNPLVDRYHASFSQINLALANSIAVNAQNQAGQAGGQGGQQAQISDQDRANISQLIQQAIAEGKSAVALNPLRAGNWEVLARIYQALIPFAQGADQFAIQSMGQAVALDPINPNLRIALGGIHYGQGNYDTAIRIFELATVAKPDHANAHYNLAFAYRENGQIDQAITEMTTVLSLLDRGTNDYETARAALEDLQSRQQAAVPPAGEELNPPQPAEEPVIEPPLELPEGSNPPESPISPTPTPTEGAEVTTTPTPTP